jgi:hypothetical protein
MYVDFNILYVKISMKYQAFPEILLIIWARLYVLNGIIFVFQRKVLYVCMAGPVQINGQKTSCMKESPDHLFFM